MSATPSPAPVATEKEKKGDYFKDLDHAGIVALGALGLLSVILIIMLISTLAGMGSS